MKRIICLITALCIVFGSFSVCFAADWTDSDKQNLQNVASRLYYMNQSAAYYLYNIATNTNNLYNKTVDIYNALFNNGHNITYWVNSINSYMSPIYTSITSIPSDLYVIQSLLGYPTNDGGGFTWHPYLKFLSDNLATNTWTYNGVYLGGSGNTSIGPYTGTFAQALLQGLYTVNQAIASQYYWDWNYDLVGFADSQTYVNPLTLSNSTFLPSSKTNGIYTWLSKIQEPAARLSYVLASPERIAAQEAAADNEEAVVDNFIDSSGQGSASTSDIGSISDLSSGYKNNFGSDASVTGIFNIFNSNNMGWFSSETFNQLDTTSNNRRSSSLPETPLLDQKIYDIYNAIGLDNDR